MSEWYKYKDGLKDESVALEDLEVYVGELLEKYDLYFSKLSQEEYMATAISKSNGHEISSKGQCDNSVRALLENIYVVYQIAKLNGGL